MQSKAKWPRDFSMRCECYIRLVVLERGVFIRSLQSHFLPFKKVEAGYWHSCHYELQLLESPAHICFLPHLNKQQIQFQCNAIGHWLSDVFIRLPVRLGHYYNHALFFTKLSMYFSGRSKCIIQRPLNWGKPSNPTRMSVFSNTLAGKLESTSLKNSNKHWWFVKNILHFTGSVRCSLTIHVTLDFCWVPVSCWRTSVYRGW